MCKSIFVCCGRHIYVGTRVYTICVYHCISQKNIYDFLLKKNFIGAIVYALC